MNKFVKLSSFPYTTLGLSIVAFGKFSIIFFSPSSLLFAYLLFSEAWSIPKAEIWINCSTFFSLQIFERTDGKLLWMLLKVFFPLSWRIPTRLMQISAEFIINLSLSISKIFASITFK